MADSSLFPQAAEADAPSLDPDKKVPDAPLCACHASIHGRPPKDVRT